MIVEGEVRIRLHYRDGESFMEATIGDVDLGDAVEAMRGKKVRFEIREIRPDNEPMRNDLVERTLGRFGG